MATKHNPIVVVGAGPAGMASALALHTAGHEVVLLERYPVSKAAGANLSLWPPPIKALELMGVDVSDLGAPVHTQMFSAKGKLRATVHIPEDVVERYGGGFIGLLRPELYERMAAALPEGVLQNNRQVAGFEDRGDHVHVTLVDGEAIDTPLLVGADGIDSLVRRQLWGDGPKREHNLAAFGGYTFAEVPGVGRGVGIVAHGRKVQASYTSIRNGGRDGYQWWMVEATDPDSDGPADMLAHARELAKEFKTDIAKIIDATPPGQGVTRWVLRDRGTLETWSRGRVTIAGDAAHATSPYAGYGAGMAIGDGYFLGKLLAGADLSDQRAIDAALTEYDRIRIPHCNGQVSQAYQLGQLMHHTPKPVQVIRDWVLNYSGFMQRQMGTKNPAEIVAQLEQMGDGIAPQSDEARAPQGV